MNTQKSLYQKLLSCLLGFLKVANKVLEPHQYRRCSQNLLQIYKLKWMYIMTTSVSLSLLVTTLPSKIYPVFVETILPCHLSRSSFLIHLWIIIQVKSGFLINGQLTNCIVGELLNQQQMNPYFWYLSITRQLRRCWSHICGLTRIMIRQWKI